MKTNNITSRRILYTCSVAFLISLNAITQEPVSGNWEGTANQFTRVPLADRSNVASPIKSKEITEVRFAKDKLSSDLLFMVENLTKYHPRLYAYTSEANFNNDVSVAIKQLSSEMTLDEYFRIIAPIIEKVHCSHTGIRMPENYLKAIHEMGNYFPLNVAVKNNEMYLLGHFNNSDPEVSPGAKIESINQVSTDRILKQLLGLVPSEGNCQTTKYTELNKDFHSYFYLLDHSEEFRIMFSTHSGKKEVVVPCCRFRDISSMGSKSGSGLPVEFSLDRKKGIGIMRISSFGIRDMDGYFQLLDSLFQDLSKQRIPNLAIDLRDNSGGHPIFAAQLLSYLTSGEFTYFKRIPGVAEFEPLYNPMPPNLNSYEGTLFVLVNGGCLSTTGHLISLLNHYTKAKFIGEQPGSTYTCNDFGMKVTLPNTGIEANIPRITFETAVPEYAIEEPFSLDHLVGNDPEDLIDGRDSYVEFLHQVIVQ